MAETGSTVDEVSRNRRSSDQTLAWASGGPAVHGLHAHGVPSDQALR